MSHSTGLHDAGSTGANNGSPPMLHSHFALSRQEILKSVANRFIFSSFYIYFYLSMAALSLTTVILSLTHECPTLPFYILEIIVNSAMIAEVLIRLVAFGNTFWKSYFNLIDIAVSVLCVLTVLVVFFSGCSAKGEEVFDTGILIVRNIIQFGRLAIVMRRSGKNIFTSGPQAIDLADASLYDLDYDEDEQQVTRPLRRNDVESS